MVRVIVVGDLSVGMAITVMEFFDAKNRENKNLILAIVLCRHFIF